MPLASPFVCFPAPSSPPSPPCCFPSPYSGGAQASIVKGGPAPRPPAGPKDAGRPPLQLGPRGLRRQLQARDRRGDPGEQGHGGHEQVRPQRRGRQPAPDEDAAGAALLREPSMRRRSTSRRAPRTSRSRSSSGSSTSTGSTGRTRLRADNGCNS